MYPKPYTLKPKPLDNFPGFEYSVRGEPVIRIVTKIGDKNVRILVVIAIISPPLAMDIPPPLQKRAIYTCTAYICLPVYVHIYIHKYAYMRLFVRMRQGGGYWERGLTAARRMLSHCSLACRCSQLPVCAKKRPCSCHVHSEP